MPAPENNGAQSENGAPATEERSLIDGGDVDNGSQPAAAATTPATEGKNTTKTEIPEEKATRETEEKRILEADPATLNDADKTKRASLEAEKEEKRLLETPKDKLSPEDQVKQAALLKAKEDKDKEGKGTKGAPESYADFKVPDGVEVNAEAMGEFKTIAKELNLSQENAQRLVDFEAKNMQRASQALDATFKTMVSDWKKDAKKELGADYKKEIAYAGKALEKLGTPELRSILNQTGVGNHKELVKFFVRVGKLVAEDTFVEGTKRTGAKSDSELFYPDMK